MKNLLFLFLLLCSFLHAADSTPESPITPKSVYLSVTQSPQTLYTREIIGVKYKLLILTEKHQEIKTSFSHYQESEILNAASPWVQQDETTFTNTFYYKILEANATLPNVTATVFIDKYSTEKDTLESTLIQPITLNGSSLFSGVLAQNLELLNHRTTAYDKEYNLLLFEATASQGNLEDFHISGIRQQGIESLQHDLPQSTMIYYAIIPKKEDYFTFEYFNLTSRDFQSIKIPNLAKEERVSTQSDIRPKQTLQLSQIFAMSVIVAISLILFIIKRKKFYLVILLLSAAYLVMLILPQKEVLLKKNAPIYILPSRYSTNYLQSPIQQRVIVLDSKKPYLKIQLPDGKIGWVKQQHVQ